MTESVPPEPTEESPYKLTPNFVVDIQKSTSSSDVPQGPVLQVLKVHRKKDQRLRFYAADGVFSFTATVTPDMGDQFSSLDTGHVIRLGKYSKIDMNNDKLVVVIYNMEILGGPYKCIGNPTTFVPSVHAKSGAAPTDTKPKAESPAPTKPKVSKMPKGFEGSLFSIASLNPFQNKFTIRARLANKGPIKTWTNAKGEGRLFSVTFVDESGEIRATGFNEELDKFYDMLQVGKIYYVSKVRMKTAKKEYSNVDHEYEMQFGRETQIEACDDVADIPINNYNFITIDKIAAADLQDSIQVLGVITEVGPVTELTAKSGRPFTKRSVEIADQSATRISVTFWNNQAKDFKAPPNSLLAIKGAKIHEFNGRSLTILSSTEVATDPDITEAHKLRGWWDSIGAKADLSNVSAGSGNQETANAPRFDLDTLNNLDTTDTKPKYFTICAHVSTIRHNRYGYPACPTASCNFKKVTEDSSGQFLCDKCNNVIDKPVYRYVLSAAVADHTGQAWLSCFDDVGRLLLGMPCDELATLEKENSEKFSKTFVDAQYKKFVIRVRATVDTFQEARVRLSAISATEVNPVEEATRIYQELTVA